MPGRYGRAAGGLLHIDHIVGNVGWHAMDEWVDFYSHVMGFSLYQHFDDNDISTEYSALMSKVMANGNGYVKFPINEPAEGRRKSQIEEYLDFYNGPGVQHLALATDDILTTVKRCRSRACPFSPCRTATTTLLQEREWARSTSLLMSWNDSASWWTAITRATCCRSFTRPVEDRPTVFFEIIQRKGSRSFGKGNFKALFEAIEREQDARGNL
jgi:4-hydroxyphenylpyruvate dioxygenase